MNPEVSWTLLNAGPAWFSALVVLGALGLASGLRSSRGLAPSRRVLLLALRAAALVAAALAILRPAREVDLVRARKSPLVFLVDTSRSMNLGPSPQAPEVARWLAEHTVKRSSQSPVARDTEHQEHAGA